MNQKIKNMKKPTGLLLTILFFVVTGCTDKAAESQKYVREAHIYLYGSNNERAYELYRQAADLNPENEEAWFGMGMTWMNKRKYQKAIEMFDTAIQLNSRYMDAFYSRGQAYFYRGENFRACEDWKIAYDLGKPNIQDKLKKCQ